MINLKKNDAIADAVRGIMEKELKGNQTKLDKNHNGHLDKQDFEILRAQKGKKVKEEAEKTEDTLVGRIKTNKKDDVGPGSDFKSSKVKLKAEEAELEENAFDYKSPRQPEPNGGSGVKKGTRYGGSKQKDDTPKGPNYDDLESGKTNWKKENDLVKTLKHGYKKEEVESLEEKNWIAGAIKHPGAETAAAKKAGMSVQAYASKHQHDSGTAGKRARLAMTLKKMRENYEEPIIDELINEVLSKDASAGDWIHDFVHSDNPKFAGKSKAERKKMALGAYYKKQNEEAVQEGLKSVAKKAFKALTGGSDEDQRKDLQRKMGVPQTGKKPTQKEEVELDEDIMTHITLGKKVKNTEGGHDQDVSHKGKKIGSISSYSHRTGTRYGMNHDASGDATAGSRSPEEAISDLRQAHAQHLKSMREESETVEEGRNDTPTPYGSLLNRPVSPTVAQTGPRKGMITKKHATRLKDRIKANLNKEEVTMESKGPTSQMDEPFITNAENKPLNNAKELASKTLKRMKNEMLGKAGTSE